MDEDNENKFKPPLSDVVIGGFILLGIILTVVLIPGLYIKLFAWAY